MESESEGLTAGKSSKLVAAPVVESDVTDAGIEGLPTHIRATTQINCGRESLELTVSERPHATHFVWVLNNTSG